MKKRTLNLERLDVESFETLPALAASGTVRAHEEVITCAHDSCTPYPSLHNTRCGCTPV